MADRAICPMCAQGEIERSEGRLDQCGDTYLPTVVWSCAVCGWLRYEPAVGAHWRPAHPPVAQARSSADPEIRALPRRAA